MDALTERRRPAWGRIVRRVLLGGMLGVLVVFGLALAFSADARYVARAGLEEARILWRRRPIAKLLADSAVSDALKQRLRLVLAARAFAADSLRLAAGQTYTTYVSVGRDTLLLVLSASRKDKLRQYQLIGRWHVDQYAYLLRKLRDMKEGDGTVLDNSMILFGAGLRDGDSHNPHNLPIVVGGRGGGRLAAGRHLVYAKDTPLSNLYVSMLDAFGTPVDRFADSTGRLPGVLA